MNLMGVCNSCGDEGKIEYEGQVCLFCNQGCMRGGLDEGIKTKEIKMQANKALGRRMTKAGRSLLVIEWIMVRGLFWEYYVTEEWNDSNCAYCLVDGDFQEMGLVSLDEIKPYIAVRTRDLSKVAPAPGWKWEKKKKKEGFV